MSTKTASTPERPASFPPLLAILLGIMPEHEALKAMEQAKQDLEHVRPTLTPDDQPMPEGQTPYSTIEVLALCTLGLMSEQQQATWTRKDSALTIPDLGAALDIPLRYARGVMLTLEQIGLLARLPEEDLGPAQPVTIH